MRRRHPERILRRFIPTTLLLCIILLCTISASQAQIHLQTFGVTQGLPQVQVNCMAEDSLGALWVGTLGGGFASFDGLTFRSVTIADGLSTNLIQDLLIDGRLIWAATQRGISIYDGIKVRNYSLAKGSIRYPNALFKTSDTIFFTLKNGQGGLGMVTHDSLYAEVSHPLWSFIRSINKSIPGVAVIHVRTDDQDKIVLLTSYKRTMLYPRERINRVFAVFLAEGKITISTDAGLFQVDQDRLIKVIDKRFPVYAFDPVSRLYAGIDNFNLVMFDVSHDLILQELNLITLSNFVDREGTLWLGTDRGLYKISFPSFNQILNDKDKSDPVTAVNVIGNQLWVGTTYQGVKIYDHNTLVNTISFDKPKENYINSIKTDREHNVYLATTGGLAIIRGKTSKPEWLYPDLIKGAVAIDFDEQNNALVAGAHEGLYWVGKGSAQPIRSPSSESIWSVSYHSGCRCFFLATNNGLKMVVDRKLSDVPIPALNDVQLSNLDWYSPDLLIIGTFGKGIFLYSLKDRSIKKIDESDGLASGTVFFVRAQKNKIWIGTERGIDLLDFDPESLQLNGINHFDEIDGLSGLETDLDAIYMKDSILVAGLVSGLFQFKGYAPLSDNKLTLKSVRLFYNQVVQPDISEAKWPKTFNHAENHLTFDYSKINKRKPESVYYRYRLEGFEQVWSNPSRSQTVTYSNLPPGSYGFTVVTSDRSGKFLYDQIHYHFVIQPAFYQTIEFKAIIVLIVGVLIFLIAYYYNAAKVSKALYLQELKDQERTKFRKEIARDFHDELGNQIARMINFMGLLRIRNELQKSIYDTLNDYSQSILTGTKDFVWALDPANDDLEHVVTHLRDFGEAMFYEKGMEFRFYGEVVSYKIPPGFSRQINLIFKEAMTNSFRHSGSDRVDFEINITSDRISLKLSDYGKGIPIADLEHPKRGLANMKERASRIGADLHIASAPKGVIIDLVLDRTKHPL